MTRLGWRAWADTDPRFDDPYVEWFHDLHGDRQGHKPDFVRQVLPHSLAGFSAADTAATGSHVFLAPDYMTNAGFADWWNNREPGAFWLPEPGEFDYPNIGADEIVVGIVDVGLAFGHRRFRRADGSTRLLAAWQQGAAVQRLASGAPQVPHLPLGAQLFEAEINTKLAQHSRDNDLTRELDQEGFNRATGLVDFNTAAADRDLAQAASHGCHVLGLAGGADPFDPVERKISQKVRFLLVSLPPGFAYGEGGAFLDYYLIYALRWIREVNTRIAQASGLSRPCPLVTNISFGKHAGSGDASQPFVGALINHAQNDSLMGDEAQDGQPLHVVMPAGNSNLDRAQAAFDLPGHAAEPIKLDWVVQPEDATSNFLEIWCKGIQPPANGEAPLELELVPPDHAAVGTSGARAGQVSTLQRVAAGDCRSQPLGRIHCERFDMPSAQPGEPDRVSYRYLVCLASDRFQGEKWSPAPAGRWQLHLKNAGEEAISVKLMVQTDQSSLNGPLSARRSYLDDPSYRGFDRQGRLRDSYGYGFRQQFSSDQQAEDLDTGIYVKRKGSTNSYADNSVVASIAGYRANDGRPAVYSSTGCGAAVGAFGRAGPTAALPTDDGYAHPGILSEGASDGSVVAMRGTSFASALATRQIVEAWLDREHDPYGAISIQGYLTTKAQRQRPPQEWFTAPAKAEKQGGGRIVPKAWRKSQRL